jgi:hypothetical protein
VCIKLAKCNRTPKVGSTVLVTVEEWNPGDMVKSINSQNVASSPQECQVRTR